ncbi:shikimate dehydrogenase [Georhizobium profundi]|jgi:shikimate dehydrogenase|uniref:Shikimate dehydrogenase n=1 Tax=Georhizobium profundi TaxID=2341112 RepID=A0A3Q8XMG9_9HYPH|nr:shikimate dehydrogenase [Georhizobium profundi]AZN71058.1 shikimate dehydrogenase [Georhizobium profundi]
MFRLGLIGDNIKRSKSPMLHRLAGRLCGLDVTYEPLIPADMGLDFDAVFDQCRESGFRGINITYPYKERVFPTLNVPDPRVRAIAACNTVIFDGAGPSGTNTDYTGFVAAFRESLPAMTPGTVAMAGAGGVGKAVAFALAELKATALHIFDTDAVRAEALANALRTNAPGMTVSVCPTIEDATEGADGIVNCTPLGMTGIPGTAVPSALMPKAGWAFDAVYTPVDTQFLMDAQKRGLATISGYELFFHQGIDAFHAFTGARVDTKELRHALRADALEQA